LDKMIPAQSAIPEVLAEILRKAPLTPEKVSFAWRSAVGPAIGRVSTVRLGEDGALHVTVTEEHWGPAIRKSSSLILKRLAALLGPDVATRLVTTASKKA
jgi:predicted nucleic acid-binding Zn ribbon protein